MSLVNAKTFIGRRVNGVLVLMECTNYFAQFRTGYIIIIQNINLNNIHGNI